MLNHKDRTLIGYIPNVLKKVREYQALMFSEQPEIFTLFDEIGVGLDNLFVVTATEYGIMRWEKILLIVPKATDDLETRRLRVLIRLRERLPFTITVLNQMLTDICGPDGYSAEIKRGTYALFVRIDAAVKSNFWDIDEMLKRVIPANLIYNMTLVYGAFEVLLPQYDSLSRVAYRSNLGGRLGISSIFWDSGDHLDAGDHWDDETKLYIKTRMALRQQVKYMPVINRYWDCGVLWDTGILCDRVYGIDMLTRSSFRIDSVKTNSQTLSAACSETATHKWDKAYVWDGTYNWDSSTVVNQTTL